MFSKDELRRLSEGTQRRWQLYDKLRGKSSSSDDFWDIVVLTAIDEGQKHAYEIQLQRKLDQEELPLAANYIVIADPPGPKIGNGGATLFVIDELHKIYEKEVFKKKIIIIHGGGFSQRLPNASILGKIFLGVPIGEPTYQTLDLKLASYIDFPSKISSGGIFVCSADTIEVYDDCNSAWQFHDEGFTGLAHLSPVSIGRTHGVYVLDQPERDSDILWHSKKFLHKPSLKLMEQTAHCVVQNKDGENWVMTDSAFFISRGTAEVLLNFYHENSPLMCEIDAYGDFLQASGENSTSEYTKNSENVCTETSSLIQTRLAIYNTLKGTPLYAALLAPVPYYYQKNSYTSQPSSIFYHIGTMPEYLNNFCHDPAFRDILCIEALSSCAGVPYLIKTRNSKEENKSKVTVTKTRTLTCRITEDPCDTPCLISTVIKPRVSIGEGSIIEYSILGTGVSIGYDCILSGCCVPESTLVPHGAFLHTIPITLENRKQFVTVAFQINANIKKTLPISKAMDAIMYFGKPLKEFYPTLKEGTVSLWTAKIFPVADTMEASFKLTTDLISQGNQAYNGKVFAMSELLQLRDLNAAVDFREALTKYITT